MRGCSRRGRLEPAGAPWHDVEEPSAADVDERRDHLGAPLGTETGHAPETKVGDDQLVAVVDHGLMGAEPADIELAGELRDSVQLASDAATHLPPRRLRQRRPRLDLW